MTMSNRTPIRKYSPAPPLPGWMTLDNAGSLLWVFFVWKMGARSVAIPHQVVGGYNEMMG